MILNRFGIGLNVGLFLIKKFGFSSPSGFRWTDTDAENYYNALVTANGGDIDAQTIYGITLDTFKSAINSHVVTLKADGVWTQLKHYYPYLGGTAATHAICMIDATSELTYGGSPTHNNMGVVTDGTTQYIDTGFTMFELNSAGDISNSDNHFMQFHQNAGAASWGYGLIDTRSFWNYSTTTNLTADNVVGGGARVLGANTEMSGMMVTSRTSATLHTAYANAISKGTATADVSIYALTFNNYNFYFGARNSSGSLSTPTTGNIMQSSIGLGLSGTQVTNFNTAINALNSAVGRTYTFTNAEASAYWDALTVANGSAIDCPTLYGASNSAVMEAIDNFYTSVKADNTYSELNELLLFIGGTSSTHAISSKTASSVLSYIGSPTHSNAGMNLNGTTQYAALPSAPSTYSLDDDNHIAVWYNTTNNECAAGARDSATQQLWLRSISTNMEWVSCSNVGASYISWPVSDTSLYSTPVIGTRTAINSSKLFMDGIERASSTTNNPYGLASTTQPVWIGCINLAGSPNNLVAGECKFFSTGTGLTDSQSETLTNAMKTLNTVLGR